MTLAFGDVTMHAPRRSTLHHHLDGLARGPCPGCATVRLLDDSWSVDICDVDGSNPRTVLLCGGCAAGAGIDGLAPVFGVPENLEASVRTCSGRSELHSCLGFALVAVDRHSALATDADGDTFGTHPVHTSVRNSTKRR